MRYRILIVDDEPGITDMIREYFEPEYEVYTADSGGEAIKKLSVKPDLILLDINMPEMDGLEGCRDSVLPYKAENADFCPEDGDGAYPEPGSGFFHSGDFGG